MQAARVMLASAPYAPDAVQLSQWLCAGLADDSLLAGGAGGAAPAAAAAADDMDALDGELGP